METNYGEVNMETRNADAMPDNMAEKILGLFPQEKPKSTPGRPIAIDDGRLCGAEII